MERVAERRAGRHPAWLAALAGPGHRGEETNGVDVEATDLRQPHAEQAEADHDLVADPDHRPVRTGRHQAAVGLLVGQPAAGVGGLDLPVGAAVGAKGAGRVEQAGGRVHVDHTGPPVPGEECGSFTPPLVDGVVGRIPPGAVDDDVALGQLRGVTPVNRNNFPSSER